MSNSEFGGAPWRLILIQVLILAGILIFFRLYLPHHERALAAQAAAAREQKIEAFFHDSVIEDTGSEVAVPLDGAIVKRHPKRLRASMRPEEAESLLGVPNTSMVDFRGGQHLIWNGTVHKVEAAFNGGHLYCLTLQDESTRHAEMVCESNDLWRLY